MSPSNESHDDMMSFVLIDICEVNYLCSIALSDANYAIFIAFALTICLRHDMAANLFSFCRSAPSPLSSSHLFRLWCLHEHGTVQ